MDSPSLGSTVPPSPGPEAPAGGTDDDRALADLQRRRDEGEAQPAAPRPLQLAEVRLVNADLSGLDLSGADLSGMQLVNCTLHGSRLVGVDLTGAVLHDVDLTEAELLGSDLTGADLANATLRRTGMGQVTAPDAILFGARCEGASFSGSDLSRADLRATDLSGTRMIQTTLDHAVLTAARLAGAELTRASVDGAVLRDADLRGAQLRAVTGYRTADWIDADISDVDFTGAWNIRRHIQDVNYIHEFRAQSRYHELLYRLWWITSDCGRSLARWTAWTVLVALLYAVAYTTVDMDWGQNRTALSPLYFSVVTFTTLGFGDILPGSATAQALAMSEVVLGYLSLGGMMSILSDKMARRAG